MKKLTIFVSALLLFLFASPARAQEVEDGGSRFFRAEVLEVLSESDQGFSGVPQPVQTLRLVILDGDSKGQEVEVEHGSLFPISKSQLVGVGDKVVVTTTRDATGEIFVITDTLRLEIMGAALATVLVAMYFLVGRKSLIALFVFALGSILFSRFGMGQIQAGADPVLVGLVSTVGFSGAYIVVIKGKSRKSLESFMTVSSVIALVAALNVFLARAMAISGFGTQEALLLQTGIVSSELILGVFIGGVMFAVTGLLIEYSGNPDKEDFTKLMTISLFLIVGGSVSLVMFIALNKDIPLWVSLNSELVAREFVRVVSVLAALLLTPHFSRFYAKKAWKSGD